MGIGVTPFASMLKSLSNRLSYSSEDFIGGLNLQSEGQMALIHKLKLKRLTFIWCAKTTKEFEWFLKILQNFEKLLTERNDKVKDKKKRFSFDLQLYITADMSKTDISHIMLSSDNDRDPI